LEDLSLDKISGPYINWYYVIPPSEVCITAVSM